MVLALLQGSGLHVGEQRVVLCHGREEVEDERQAGRTLLLAPAKSACALQFEVRLEDLLD